MPAIREMADPLRRDEALGRSARLRASRSVCCARSWSDGRRGRGSGRPASGTRITADAVLSSPDALPIGDILRAITPVEVGAAPAAAAGPRRAGPGHRAARPEELPSTVARELYRAIVLQREPDDQGIRPPFDRAALLPGLDEKRPRSPDGVVCEAGPGPADARAASSTTRSSRLLLDIEDDQLRDRSEYNEAAQSEAERAGDAEAIDRLMLEKIQINEARRSLDRRRDQTRLLASHRR